jgi:RimJ/RimL family protein N-acetyltransferase
VWGFAGSGKPWPGGMRRVVVFMPSEIKLTPLNESGLSVLETWFQDAELRKRLGGMLPLRRWFDYVRTDPGRFIWMAYEQGAPVGFLDLETFGGHTAWVTLLVNPELRNRGYGTRILRALFSRPEVTSLKRVKAVAERENIASLRILWSLGFGVEWAERDEEGFVILTYGLSAQQAA